MTRLKVFLGLFAAVLCLASFWLFRVGPPVEVAIPQGSPAREVAALLVEKGVLSNPWGFRLLARATRLERALKPGTYSLREGMSSPEALYKIYRGGLTFIRVTIPEGWRESQIAARLGDLGVTDSDAFREIVIDRSLEGYLFPTTYFLEADMPAERVVSLMRQEFDRQVNPLLREHLSLPMPLEKIVILASIVEREARLAREKPLIARVYLNRLKKGWSLEADPTVQYALGFWKKDLNLVDLKYSSLYNTYRHGGLPPGPICSPGTDSIRAVLEPAESDAMYFVADNTGGHTFHTNLKDHVEASRRAKLERQRRKEQERRKAQGAKGGSG